MQTSPSESLGKKRAGSDSTKRLRRADGFSRSELTLAIPKSSPNFKHLPPSRITIPSREHDSEALKFHAFASPPWTCHIWRTTLFRPPTETEPWQSMSTRVFTSAGFHSLGIYEKTVVEALAFNIDNFLKSVDTNPNVIWTLDRPVSEGYNYGRDSKVIPLGLMTCIVLDRLCWAMDLAVQRSPFQYSYPITTEPTAPRKYRGMIRTIRDAAVITTQMTTIPKANAGGLLDRVSLDTFIEGVNHRSLADRHAIITNVCFASVAMLLFATQAPRGSDLNVAWKRITDHFQKVTREPATIWRDKLA